MIPEQIPVNQYYGNNSDTTFDFDFFIEDDDELKVTLTDYDGTQTVLVKNVDYTIHETGNKNGSYITFPYITEQYQSTYGVLGYDATTEQAQMLTLELVIPIEQPSEYTNSNTLAIKNIEKSLDYGIRVDQMLDAKINRLDSNQSDFESNIIEEMNDFMVEESVARQTFESTMQQAQSEFETTIANRQTTLENTVSSTLSTQNQQIQTLTSDTESSLETMNAQLTTMSENMTNFENSITAQEASHQTAVSEYLEDITAAKNEISGDFSDLQENYASFKEEVNTALDGKADESDLSDVAFSGSYDDLNDKPNIPLIDQTFDGTSTNAQSGVAIEGALNNKVNYTNLGNVDCEGDVLAYCRENLTDTGYYSFHDVGDGYDWFVSTQNNERHGEYSIFQFIWGETEDITIQYSYDNGSEWFDYSYAKRSDLATVATSGSYNDLTNKPTVDQTYDWTSHNAQSGVAIEGILTEYPQNEDLSEVAFSGSYNDLSDKPSIPSAQVQSDWNQSDNTAVDYIKNKPTIPAAQIQSDWNQTNTSAKDYIKNKPTIPSGVVVDQTYNASSANAQSGIAIAGELSNYTKTSGLSTVATSGSYNDLLNKPTIPSISNLANKDLSNLSNTGNSKFQSPLISGTNIKTINNTSLLGSGNIDTSEVFIAEYDVTSFADIETAYNAGKAVFCSDGNGGMFYKLFGYTPNSIRFTDISSNTTYWAQIIKNPASGTGWSMSYSTLQNKNLVTSLSSSSTDTQYPSAKCVYDNLALKQNKVTITYED